MIDISNKDILDIIFELTHIKDEEGNDVPHFCFASDIATDLEAKEEEIALIAAKDGYTIYKVFPGETMLGGLLIVADGCTIEPVEKMYKEFYGEVPEIAALELTDDDKLVEIQSDSDKLSEDLSGDLEKIIKEIVSKYEGESDSKLHIMDAEPDTFMHEYEDSDDIDFSKFMYHKEGEHEDDYGAMPPLVTFLLTGGLNGSGEWKDYLENISKLFKELEKETGLHIEIQTLDTDIPDDVWTAEVLMYKDAGGDLDESLSRLTESLTEKKKKTHINKVGDPNAKAMWGRTRHRVELPKKGKGSFKRHSKHKLHEIFVTPSEQDQNSFLNVLKGLGFIIESVTEENIDEDNAGDIHIQIYDGQEFPHSDGESVEETYYSNKEAIDGRMRELADTIHEYDASFEHKFRITYSIGFGGTTRSGVDCSGRVTAGIDMRAYWVEPELVDLNMVEDLDLSLVDPKEESKSYMDDIEAAFTKDGATVQFYTDINPRRQDAVWYMDEAVALINYGDIHIEILSCGELDLRREGENPIYYDDELEDAGYFEDDDLYGPDAGVSWEMNPWWDFRIWKGDDAREAEWGADMGYDCMYSLSEALDPQGWREVIDYYVQNYCEEEEAEIEEPLSEGNKKKNPLKAAAKKHAKTDKKGAIGWFIHPNVEQSIQHFNHVANGSAESTITAPAGLGEDISLDVMDRYEWSFELASNYRMMGYKFDDESGSYTNETYWTVKIPETCMKVSRDDYKTNKLLTMPKNKKVLEGVEEFFKQHKTAKYCIIGCRDVTQHRFVNVWRVLLEESLTSLDEAQDDYWVLSDGKNPKNSNVYTSIDNIEEFIARLESTKPHSYWELLHYVNGNPEKVWSTDDIKEDLDLDVMTVKNPRGIHFVAKPREDFMTKGSGWGRYRHRYPEFRMPANGKQIFKSLYRAGHYNLCDAAKKVVDKFFVDYPQNKYCVLLAYYNSNNKAVDASGESEGIWGNQLTEAAEKHDTLNPLLWDEGNKLKPEVREKILEISKDFTDGLEEDGIKFKLDDIVLVGSNCSYNYTDKSDLDIHLRMDTDSLECPDDLYPLLYSAYRSLYNNKMDIDFYGIPVEIYVETSDTEQMNDKESGEITEARKQSALKSNGIYSVLNDEWIKEPVKEDIPEIDQEAFENEFAKWEDRYFDIVGDSIFSEDDMDDIVEEALEKIKFYYAGPLYRFEHLFRRHWEAYTEAVTFKKAVNNFNAKAKEEFGFTYGARLNIDPNYIEVVESEPESEYDDVEPGSGRCEKCGRYLNDSGECPLCDLGDESVLDESVLDESVNADKIDEIEEFIEDIYDLRKESIANDGEYGIGNLVFKEIRNLGYLDNLKELKNALKSKKFSLPDIHPMDEHLSKEQLRKRVPEITEDDVRSWINNHSGWDMTIDPDTLSKADFANLPEGWVVTQNFGLDNLFDPKDYAGMTEFIKNVLLTYGDKYYIGTYKMRYGKNRGKIAIDVNKIIKDTREAIIDGIKNLQESIYRYDEYLFLTHGLISRRTGKKKPYPLAKDELKDYGLEDSIVSEPSDKCMTLELVDGLFPTNIPSTPKKK